MSQLLQRKYIDLIRHVCSKWVNWDPAIPVQVGAYGGLDSETGDLRVEGNIYDPDFQAELDKLGLGLRMADHPPEEESGDEVDFIITSNGAHRVDLPLGLNASVAGLAAASIKGQWQFERGKRDALLIMDRPRLKYVPRDVVLEQLYRIPKLKDKCLVTNVHVCPAFCMYLSDKSGEKVSLARLGQVPVHTMWEDAVPLWDPLNDDVETDVPDGVSLALRGQVPVPAAPVVSTGADASVGWWSDVQADLLRKGCDKTGRYCYTPLYTMKRRITWYQRLFRPGPAGEEAQGDATWEDATPPWDPLGEDGEEDTLDMLDPSPIEP